jgi:hypothetical protein
VCVSGGGESKVSEDGFFTQEEEEELREHHSLPRNEQGVATYSDHLRICPRKSVAASKKIADLVEKRCRHRPPHQTTARTPKRIQKEKRKKTAKKVRSESKRRR